MYRNRVDECYDQYKKDTEILASFLKDEGVKFDCPSRLLRAPETSGKQHPYVLYLSNFKRIANRLATHDTFSMPADIMAALDRAIELRTECNIIYEKQYPKETAKNETHKHAIDELRDVRRILLPNLAARPPEADAEMQTLSSKH